MSWCLEVSNLRKSFRTGFFLQPKTILKDISFQVPSNKTTGFIGGNGQGKTTTIKCLLGSIFPEKGEMLFWGEKLTKDAKNRIGFLPERPYYYMHLTASEYLKFHWNLSGRRKIGFVEKKQKLLSLVELSKFSDQPLKTFSKGMLQRIGLAQSLLCDPEFLILDEPMSGLDPDGRLLVKDILKTQKKNGVSIFFSSHLLADMDELCDYLVVIDQGQIFYNGQPEGFRKTHPDLEEAFRNFRKIQQRS